MTDGASCLIKNMKESGDLDKFEPEVKAQLEEAYKRLTSRNPSEFWTSGQWMTEVRGGSDVSGAAATYALKEKG